jgi:hypothetical protein
VSENYRILKNFVLISHPILANNSETLFEYLDWELNQNEWYDCKRTLDYSLIDLKHVICKIDPAVVLVCEADALATQTDKTGCMPGTNLSVQVSDLGKNIFTQQNLNQTLNATISYNELNNLVIYMKALDTLSPLQCQALQPPKPAAVDTDIYMATGAAIGASSTALLALTLYLSCRFSFVGRLGSVAVSSVKTLFQNRFQPHRYAHVKSSETEVELESNAPKVRY